KFSEQKTPERHIAPLILPQFTYRPFLRFRRAWRRFRLELGFAIGFDVACRPRLVAQEQLDGHILERRVIAQVADEGTPIRLVEQLRAVREEHDSRRADGGLRGVVDSWLAVEADWRRLQVQRLLDQAIDLAGWHAGGGLLVQVAGQVQHLLDVAAVLRGDEG